MKDEQLMQLQKRIYDMEGIGKDMEKEMHGLRDELNRRCLRAELAEQEAEDFRRRVRDLEHQLIEKSKMMQELMLDSSASTSSVRHPFTRFMTLTILLPTRADSVTMLQNGKSIRAHATEVNSVCFSGSGKVAAFTASSDGTPLIFVRVSEDGELVLSEKN
ncbi:hypothetical protein H310_08282 [Aphanomyces invadans]|uniref:Uncharacterized protein n=1 Tax=Aphanomyces invadans TaxID=157072 RepID=A0A024U047_9STRA|nr:hypothetical protein H310_08282 [Aphanomyces invadans]ETV99638.1 hypothetical protein H310_08282 [Aphanomyces invadans]|eukprot:XP_008872194.1 hypothetical protein H310_08282 [Aphanomyces invadans]